VVVSVVVAGGGGAGGVASVVGAAGEYVRVSFEAEVPVDAEPKKP
jgi:hypothetical protein